MKKNIGLLTLLTCALSSCGISDTGKTPGFVRTYAPFGSMNAAQVENVCKTYADRTGNPLYASHVYLVEELGVFGNGNIYVDILKTDLTSFGIGVPCVCVDVVVHGTYVLTLGDPSYSVNVYVDGANSSYSLVDAYDRGIILDDDIKAIAKWKAFDTTLEDFTFKFYWGGDVRHSYDSETETLIKEYSPRPGSGKTREDYTTTYHYPKTEELYEKVKAINLYSFPTNFDPYEGTNLATDPKCDYDLHIGYKTIYANNCPIVSGYPEGIMPQGRKFLELVFDIIDTIENSDEWKALPELSTLSK